MAENQSTKRKMRQKVVVATLAAARDARHAAYAPNFEEASSELCYASHELAAIGKMLQFSADSHNGELSQDDLFAIGRMLRKKADVIEDAASELCDVVRHIEREQREAANG